MQRYSIALATWYRKCRKLDTLPPHWERLVRSFEHDESDGMHLFIRPDFMLTDQGLKCVEMETSPFGLGLSLWLQNIYEELGFKTVGNHSWHQKFPDGLKFVTTEHTNQYEGQLTYLVDLLKREGKEACVENSTSLTPHDGRTVYRAFYLYEHSLEIDALLREEKHCPPSEMFVESKLPLALAWDDINGTDPLLREIIPPTWVVKHGFPCPLSSWEDIANMPASKRLYVLKLAGCDKGSSWGENVHFLHKISKEKCGKLLEEALKGTALYVLQKYTESVKFSQMWFDFESGSEKTMHGRVRLTPYVNPHNGEIFTAKIAMREHTELIHGATDAIITTVG
ncbi:MAG: hypothetical protein AAB595_01710 [Patescibacteria group bacterium]